MKMPKKMKILSIFKSKEAKQPWQWPSCNHPKTLSFRAESLLPNSLECASFSTDEEKQSLEVVIRGVRLSERLFFEPNETSSITKDGDGMFPFKDSIVLAMESHDPYLDFKKSMEEMVESRDLLRNWDCLEELLGWYLRLNGKMNRALIVGAFVDMLIGLASSSSNSTLYSSSSSFSSPPFLHLDGLSAIGHELI